MRGASPAILLVRLCPRLQELHPRLALMADLVEPTPPSIISMGLPRNTCVACVHCSRGFAFLAVACPPLQPDGPLSSSRYFVQRRALPECLLLNTGKLIPGKSGISNSSVAPKTSATDPYSYPCQVHVVMEELFEAMAVQLLQWSLATLLAQSQSANIVDSRRHLLLLPDIRLSHFPFEGLKTVKKLFGCHVTRDFSLHMFARRMQHSETQMSPQPRKSVAEMHTGFARESLLLLPEAFDNSTSSTTADTECPLGRNCAEQAANCFTAEYEAAMELQSPNKTLKTTGTPPPQSPKHLPKRSWRSVVVAELSAAKKGGLTEGGAELYSCTSSIPELLCSASPHVAWTSSVDKLVVNPEDLKAALAAMDLTHISLFGLLGMRDFKQSSKGAVTLSGRISCVSCYQQQKAAQLSDGIETLLLLSSRGMIRP